MNNFKKASIFLSCFENPSDEFMSYITTIYGEDSNLVNNKLNKYISALKSFINKFSDRDVIISRAPGRVNLMGRHIEHRGGNINTVAIQEETIMICALRDDDIINISNVNPDFSDYAFSISEELSLFKYDSWLENIDTAEIKEKVLSNKGHWSNYVKGAVFRFQLETQTPLKGMDIMCLGTVPVAGGVSSSSSIVMATAELIITANNLDFELPDFITLCGQSEWYVGSRGGAGDHAAIKCGMLDSISPISFEPINPHKAIKLPDGYSVIVANSFIEAKKSEGAKDKFNQMVASYEFGVMLIKKNYPELKDKIKHLRDINPVTLGVSEKEIYQMLLSIPLTITPEELFIKIPEEYHNDIKRIMSSHKAPECYNLRSAVLYGISECERSKICSDLLKQGKTEEFAEIMNISHNGDRVGITINNEITDYDFLATDEKLISLIEMCDKKSLESALYKQPGGYACSVKEIDALTDKLLTCPGVLSVQLSGAGLGGCIMIFCEKARREEILEFLRTSYYNPNGYPDGAFVIKPIKGSMCLKLD